VVISTRNGVTHPPEVEFFLSPETPLHRQYEALRCYFVEEISSKEVARRFGYSPAAFRVLCHQFRHEPSKRTGFFREVRRGPHKAPARDRVRELAVAMRKRNLSVYDIQRELASAGHTISINALSVLLREEGFARLPRRRDEERPATVKAEAAAVANVRQLSLVPRSFRTRVGGLFLFIPLMEKMDLDKVVRQVHLPGSSMIPAEQAVRVLLALKLIGKERKSHVMDLVFEQGIALFAGLNVVPKRSYLAAYSSGVDHNRSLQLMAAWFEQAQRAGLKRGSSIDLDFHTVPANTQEEPLEKHYVSSRSRSQKGILVFLARDASERVLCYANAGITKAEQPSEILRFVDFWQKHTKAPPAELVFDSQLTTYEHLKELNRRAILFMTLRRRSKKMLGEIWSHPASAWHRITLRSLTRTFRTPKVLDERIHLKEYGGELRQVTVIDLGHEEPTILLTNNFKISCTDLVTRYAQRMLIENGISEAIQFFHIDALSSMVGLKVDFDLQITLMASSLYRLMAERIGREYKKAQAKKIFRNLLDVSATVVVEEHHVIVKLDKRAHNPYLVASGLANSPTPMPWFGEKNLVIEFS
jgi:transposase-like protein